MNSLHKKENLNNLYNFKNSIRHFLNIDNIVIPKIDDFTIENISWSVPVKFRIRKDECNFRVLKMPNLLNFIYALHEFEALDNFYSIDNIDGKKRICPNIITGDFKTNNYSENLENDFNYLCIYDNLIRLDIKSFYGRLYLHNLQLEDKERFVSNMNNGATNELLLGNYISLFVAERFLRKISNDLSKKFEEEQIDCEFSYFSDDFYFFCNSTVNSKVISIFDEVLDKYELERNGDKISVWNYDEYSNYNLVEKYWKKIVREDIDRYYSSDGKLKEGMRIFHFINQLVYRKSNLKDVKLQKIFINNFFKSTYFNNLEWEKYDLKDFNCHQLFSLFKFSPEALLYALSKFKKFPTFVLKIKKFLQVRYSISLTTNFYEEQLYYFYAIKLLNYDELLISNKALVLKGDNQILKSYYLMYNFFDTEDVNSIKNNRDESQWFLNYHLILYNVLPDEKEKYIYEYLVPKFARNKDKKETQYFEFYKLNLLSRISLIKDINVLEHDVNSYINLKIDERNMSYKNEEIEILDCVDDYLIDYENLF